MTYTQRPPKICLSLEGREDEADLTLPAMLLAHGLAEDLSRIAVINTYKSSSSMYSNLVPLNMMFLEPPFHPAQFTEALNWCEEEGKQVVIIDRLSDEWDEEGGLYDRLKSDNFQPSALRSHVALMRKVYQSPLHIISTIIMGPTFIPAGTTKKGRTKLNMIYAPSQQDDIRKLFNVVLSVKDKQSITVLRDNTALFTNVNPFAVTVETGQRLKQWCEQQTPSIPEDLQERINACQSEEELREFISEEDPDDEEITKAFNIRLWHIEQEEIASLLLKKHSGLR